jgi:hypothetical protein
MHGCDHELARGEDLAMYAIHMLTAAEWTTVPESDAIVDLLRQLESHAEATQGHEALLHCVKHIQRELWTPNVPMLSAGLPGTPSVEQGTPPSTGAALRKAKMRERQAAIMAQFAARQQAFAASSPGVTEGDATQEEERACSLCRGMPSDRGNADASVGSAAAGTAYGEGSSSAIAAGEESEQRLGLVALIQRSNVARTVSIPRASGWWHGERPLTHVVRG